MDAPTTTRLTRITLRALKRSKKCPRNGWVIPLTSHPTAATTEIVVRFHSNSSLIGMTKTPKPLRAPVVTKAMNIAVPRMYHP